MQSFVDNVNWHPEAQNKINWEKNQEKPSFNSGYKISDDDNDDKVS